GGPGACRDGASASLAAGAGQHARDTGAQPRATDLRTGCWIIETFLTWGSGRPSGRLLDRDVDHASPFGPRPVVIADAIVPEQFMQHEPRVRRALADAAVRDDVLVGRHALAGVMGTQVLGALEGAVLLHGLGPRG